MASYPCLHLCLVGCGCSWTCKEPSHRCTPKPAILMRLCLAWNRLTAITIRCPEQCCQRVLIVLVTSQSDPLDVLLTDCITAYEPFLLRPSYLHNASDSHGTVYTFPLQLAAALGHVCSTPLAVKHTSQLWPKRCGLSRLA